MDFNSLRSRSLTETFSEYVEKLIVSGELEAGERLPTERELAAKTGVSRPVVHESLVKLESKGLVRIVPRHGVFVKDFRSSASAELLVSRYLQPDGLPSGDLLGGFHDVRVVIECEIAYLAAVHATLEHLSQLEEILQSEQRIRSSRKGDIAEVDHRFRLALAEASGNIVYPLLMNALRPVFEETLRTAYADTEFTGQLFAFHRSILDSILAQDSDQARIYMAALLERCHSS